MCNHFLSQHVNFKVCLFIMEHLMAFPCIFHVYKSCNFHEVVQMSNIYRRSEVIHLNNWCLMSLIRVGGKVVLGTPTWESRVMSFSCFPNVLVLDKQIIGHICPVFLLSHVTKAVESQFFSFSLSKNNIISKLGYSLPFLLFIDTFIQVINVTGLYHYGRTGSWSWVVL